MAIDKSLRYAYRFGGHPGASHEGVGSGQTSSGRGTGGGQDFQPPQRAPVYTAPEPDFTPDYSSLDNEEQSAVDRGEPTAQITPKERNEQGYGPGGTSNPDYVAKQFEETGDLDVFTDLTGFDTAPKVDVKDIMGEVTDPGSVSYDPDYKTPEEIRTLSQDPNYGQFFRQPPVVETPKSGIMSKIFDVGKEVALNMFLPKPMRTALGYYKGAKNVSNFLAKKGITNDDIFKLGMAKLKTLKGGELIDDKIDTQKKYTKKLVTGDERKDDIVKQVSGGKDIVTKTAKKFTGITDEQRTELIKRRNIVQGILDQGVYEGEKITGEQRNNLINYIEQISKFIVDPMDMAAHGGRIGKALEGRNRYI